MRQREGENEKKGQASAEEKMFRASDDNTDMSQTGSGAVTVKECNEVYLL